MHDHPRRRIRVRGLEPLEGESMTQGQPVAPASASPSASAGRPGEPGAPAEPDGDAQPGSVAVERLTADLQAAQAQAAEHLAMLQRTAAEFQNYRRRTTEEREREAGLAGEHLLKKVLAIADDFDRAIDSLPADFAGNTWVEGITAIDRKLRGLLESEGVRPIEAMGRPFDPREHEAIANVPGTGRPDGEVVAEVQRGYRLRDRVLRPALVAIALAGDTQPPSGGAN